MENSSRKFVWFPWILVGLFSLLVAVLGVLMYVARHEGPEGDLPLVVVRRLAEKIYPNIPVKEAESFNFTGVETLEIKTARADIILISAQPKDPQTEAALTLSGSIPDNGPAAETRIEKHFSVARSGTHYEIRAVDDFTREKGFFHFESLEAWASDARLKLTLKVPANFQGRVRLLSSSGNVSVEGLSLKRLEVRTVSGAIQTRDVQSPELDLQSARGAINGERPPAKR